MDDVKINREVRVDGNSAAPLAPRKTSRITKKEIWLIIGSIVLITAGYFTYRTYANATLDVSLRTNSNLESSLVAYYTFDDAASGPGVLLDDTGNLNSAFSTTSGAMIFTSTGTTTFTVPTGVTYLSVKAWGAGGGGGGGEGSTGLGGDGGGGAFAESVISVIPGESLNVVVGAGGATPAATSKRAGGGGGMSTLRRGNTDLVIAAGGGGGGGSEVTLNGGNGGAGGGTAGSSGANGANSGGTPGGGGGGGTSSAGGSSGAAGTSSTAGAAGIALAGGAGANGTGGGTGGGSAGGAPGGGTGGASIEPSGGGGGAGYFGGGGGGGMNGTGSGGGGGGGSSYATGFGYSLLGGSGTTTAYAGDSNYTGTFGYGGVGVTGTTGNAGSGGRIVLASTTVPTTLPGRIGQAGYFDGSTKYFDVVPTSQSSLTGTFTIAVWAKPATTTDGLDTIIGSRGPSDNSFDLKFQNNSKIHADIGNGSAWLTSNADATFSYANDTWYHIVYVVTPTTYTIYINGSQAGSGSYTSDTPVLFDRLHKLQIGHAGSNLPGEYFKGSIDDLRIYSSALSPANITRLYHLGATTKIATNISNSSVEDAGLIGRWTFDGTTMISNVADVSGKGKTMYMSGFTSTSSAMVPGREGQAILFQSNTTNKISRASDSAFDLSATSFTIAAWIKPDATTPGSYSKFAAIINKNSGADTDGWQFRLGGDINNPYYVGLVLGNGSGNYYSTQDGGSNNIQTVIASSTRWYHVAATFDNNSKAVKLYVNGADATGVAQSFSGTVTTNSNTINIGVSQSNTNTFPGAIDDVRVYTRALSATEIKRIYDKGATTHIATTINKNTNNSSSLIGYWNFDGNNVNWKTGTVNDSAGANNGTVIAMSTSSSPVPGRMGQALLFNGSTQYVNMGNVNNFTTDYHITLAAWVKTTATAEGILVAKFNNSSPFNGWELDVNYVAAGTVSFQMANSCSANVNCLISRTSGTTVNDGRWHHIVATNDGTGTIAGTKIYIDGVSQAVTNVSNTLSGTITNTTPMEIGARGAGSSGSASLPCGCAIDDVRVYNRTLSAAEVLRLYQTGK